jgi:hypothetical protein
VRKRVRIFAILFFLAIAATSLVWLVPSEPSFDGKPLSSWICTMFYSEEGPKKDAARAVVRRLSVGSVPLLLKWLREEEHPSLVARIDGVRHKVFYWLVNLHVLKNGPISGLPDHDPGHRTEAMWALPELGAAERKEAIPVLIQMLGEKKPKVDEPSDNASLAWYVLSKMDLEAIQPLMDALSSRDWQTWALAAEALGARGDDAKAALPLVAKRLNDPDVRIRISAAESIGKLGGDPVTFIPVVIQSLREPDTNWLWLDTKLEMLTHYKGYAQGAVPVLLEISNKMALSTNQDDAANLGSVKNALQKIADDKTE